jgi:hypothetical protein
MPDENLPPEELPEDEPAPSEILAGGIADLLNKQEIADSLAQVLRAVAKNKSEEPHVAKFTFVVGMAFSAIVFAGVCILGWFKIISAEAVTGLLGALIGYWYGREQSRNR